MLDGGLSNQLESQGCNLDHPLWTGRLLMENPKAILKAHLVYLEAGAQCLITSSYQASIAGFAKLGLTHKKAEHLLIKSVDIAREAVGIFLRKYPEKPIALIAASIGPYGAYLADGSEYTGDYELSETELREFHLSRIRILDASEADILACETMPSFQEARVVADLLLSCKKKAWLTFSCRDEQHINDGSHIGKCIDFLKEHPTIFALGVNCTKPEYISGLIENIRPYCGEKKIIVYPNSGQLYDSKTKTWREGDDVTFTPNKVKQWLALGAEMVGGCCRVGPDQIKQVADQIPEFK